MESIVALSMSIIEVAAKYNLIITNNAMVYNLLVFINTLTFY